MTIEQLEKEVKRLTDVKNEYRRRCWSEYMRRLRAEAGIHAVRDLIADSEGVAGLHLNGDMAPWDELRTGGRFEEWLKPFDDAIAGTPNAENQALTR